MLKNLKRTGENTMANKLVITNDIMNILLDKNTPVDYESLRQSVNRTTFNQEYSKKQISDAIEQDLINVYNMKLYKGSKKKYVKLANDGKMKLYKYFSSDEIMLLYKIESVLADRSENTNCSDGLKKLIQEMLKVLNSKND